MDEDTAALEAWLELAWEKRGVAWQVLVEARLVNGPVWCGSTCAASIEAVDEAVHKCARSAVRVLLVCTDAAAQTPTKVGPCVKPKTPPVQEHLWSKTNSETHCASCSNRSAV